MERLQGVAMVMVAACEHPLAGLKVIVPMTELARHVQRVLTDRSDLTAGREFGVMSPLTWRLGDLFAKHSFLLKGLGWGGRPMYAVEEDLRESRLARLSIEDVAEGAAHLGGLSRNHRELRIAGTSIACGTGVRDEADRIMGLEFGADDYLTKPFSPRELLTRIRSVLRRSKGAALEAGQRDVRAYRFTEFESQPAHASADENTPDNGSS